MSSYKVKNKLHTFLFQERRTRVQYNQIKENTNSKGVNSSVSDIWDSLMISWAPVSLNTLLPHCCWMQHTVCLIGSGWLHCTPITVLGWCSMVQVLLICWRLYYNGGWSPCWPCHTVLRLSCFHGPFNPAAFMSSKLIPSGRLLHIARLGCQSEMQPCPSPPPVKASEYWPWWNTSQKI